MHINKLSIQFLPLTINTVFIRLLELRTVLLYQKVLFYSKSRFIDILKLPRKVKLYKTICVTYI